MARGLLAFAHDPDLRRRQFWRKRVRYWLLPARHVEPRPFLGLRRRFVRPPARLRPRHRRPRLFNGLREDERPPLHRLQRLRAEVAVAHSLHYGTPPEIDGDGFAVLAPGPGHDKDAVRLVDGDSFPVARHVCALRPCRAAQAESAAPAVRPDTKRDASAERVVGFTFDGDRSAVDRRAHRIGPVVHDAEVASLPERRPHDIQRIEADGVRRAAGGVHVGRIDAVERLRPPARGRARGVPLVGRRHVADRALVLSARPLRGVEHDPLDGVGVACFAGQRSQPLEELEVVDVVAVFRLPDAGRRGGPLAVCARRVRRLPAKAVPMVGQHLHGGVEEVAPVGGQGKGDGELQPGRDRGDMVGVAVEGEARERRSVLAPRPVEPIGVFRAEVEKPPVAS